MSRTKIAGTAALALFVGWLLLWGVTVAGDSPQFSTLTARNAPAPAVGSVLTFTNSIGFAISVASIELFVRWTAQDSRGEVFATGTAEVSRFGTFAGELTVPQGLRLLSNAVERKVDASGNLMVVFTDGRDSDLKPRGRPLSEDVMHFGEGAGLVTVRLLREAGYEVLVANDISVLHVGGESSRARPFWVERQKHLFDLRSQAVTEKLEDPSQLGKTRKDIARIKTIARQKAAGSKA